MATNAELVKLFQDWEKRSQTHWNPIFAEMKRDDRMYQNRINWTKTKKTWMSQVSIPLAFRTVQVILSIIKDFLPGTDIIPREENDVDFQELIQLRFDHEADRCDLDGFKMDMAEDMLRMKNGIGLITWKDGGVYAEALNPMGGVLFDEMATNVKTSSWIICRFPMRLSDILREKGIKAKADAIINEQGMFEPFDLQNESSGPGGRTTVEELDTTGSFADGGETYASEGMSGLEGNDFAFVKDIWYTDPKTGEEMYAELINETITSTMIAEITDPETGEVFKPKKRGPVDNSLNSPGGYGRKPIFLMKNNGSKHSLYGSSETGLTTSIDLAYMDTTNIQLDWSKKAANPPRFVLRSFFQGMLTRFHGKDAEEVVVNRPDEVGFLNLPPAPMMASKLSADLKTLHDDISGVRGIEGVLGGNAPGGVTSGIALGELAEASQANIRYKVDKNLGDMIKEASKFIIFLILKFDSGSLMLTKEEDGNIDFKEWDAAVFRNDIGFMLDKMDSWEDTPFNIKVRSGQQQPQTRAERIARAEKLATMEINPRAPYGIEDLVKELGLSDGARKIERYYERQGWSPEAVTQISEGLVAQMVQDPENEVVQSQLELLQKIFPTIVGETLKKVEKGEA